MKYDACDDILFKVHFQEPTNIVLSAELWSNIVQRYNMLLLSKLLDFNTEPEFQKYSPALRWSLKSFFWKRSHFLESRLTWPVSFGMELLFVTEGCSQVRMMILIVLLVILKMELWKWYSWAKQLWPSSELNFCKSSLWFSEDCSDAYSVESKDDGNNDDWIRHLKVTLMFTSSLICSLRTL